MARQQSQIQQSLIANLVAAAALVGVVVDPAHWSDYDYRQLITYVVSVAMATLEQLWDAFKADVLGIAQSAAPQTPKWIQKQMLLFQYDATTPQIIQFDETTEAPYYPVVDASKRIITNCSVIGNVGRGTTVIKVAKGGTTPVPLATLELAAAQSVANTIGIPGITYDVQSKVSDKMYVEPVISYVGQYSAVIVSTLTEAIDTYLNTIPFNGNATLDGLMQVILAVPGVISCVFKNVSARPDTTAFTAGSYNLCQNYTWQQNSWPTVAGYIVAEDTVGHTLADTIPLNLTSV